MKYLILALAALGLFSCVNGKNVAENKSKQRTIASFQELGLNEQEANDVAREASNYQAPAGAATISFDSKLAYYKGLATSFNNAASSKVFSAKQKVEIMKNDADLAEKRINSYTGGSGTTHYLLMNRLNAVRSYLNKNDPAGAAQSAMTSTAWAIKLAEAMK